MTINEDFNMAKTILGIDIGYDNLKLALVNGRQVLRTASFPMPKNLVRDGNIVSDESMGELLRTSIKESGMKTKFAACVLSDENVFVKNVVMPQMTADQLTYNLPFEFRDYISGEIRDYVFDYAMQPLPDHAENNADSSNYNNKPEGESEDTAGSTDAAPPMALMAVSAPRAYMDETRQIMRKAGMRLTKAAPAVCAFIQLIRANDPQAETSDEEYCIIDLGYNAIRMHMFRGDRYNVTRALDIGLSVLDEALADYFSVDIHLAHTYLMTNFENCLFSGVCEDAYQRIAMELMRVLNFYRYSNPDSALHSVMLCGGGSVIEPLREAIGNMLDLDILPAGSLVPGGDDIEDCDSFVQAIGIAMD